MYIYIYAYAFFVLVGSAYLRVFYHLAGSGVTAVIGRKACFLVSSSCDLTQLVVWCVVN